MLRQVEVNPWPETVDQALYWKLPLLILPRWEEPLMDCRQSTFKPVAWLHENLILMASDSPKANVREQLFANPETE